MGDLYILNPIKNKPKGCNIEEAKDSLYPFDFLKKSAPLSMYLYRLELIINGKVFNLKELKEKNLAEFSGKNRGGLTVIIKNAGIFFTLLIKKTTFFLELLHLKKETFIRMWL